MVLAIAEIDESIEAGMKLLRASISCISRSVRPQGFVCFHWSSGIGTVVWSRSVSPGCTAPGVTSST